MDHDACPMAIALREKRAVRGSSAIAARPDGTSVEFEPYPTPLLDASGRLLGAVNVMVDVTERKRAEAALRATAEALATSNAVKDEFLGLISHELRTPVTTIYGNAQLLRDRGATLPDEQRDGMIADVAEDSDRLLAIIENLLLLSRLQSGIRPETEPQVLDHVVRQEIGAFQRRHRDVEIRLSAPTDHVIVDADRTHLVVLLQNLLSNAVKYGQGAPIDVRLEADAGEARVLVLDSGLGFGDDRSRHPLHAVLSGAGGSTGGQWRGPGATGLRPDHPRAGRADVGPRPRRWRVGVRVRDPLRLGADELGLAARATDDGRPRPPAVTAREAPPPEPVPWTRLDRQAPASTADERLVKACLQTRSL